MYVVQKSFGGPKGRRFEPNELIDAEGFRNLPLLIEQRYLRVATKDEIDSAEEEDVDDEDIEDEEEDEEEEGEEEVKAVSATRKSAAPSKSKSPSSKSARPPMKATLKKKRKGGR